LYASYPEQTVAQVKLVHYEEGIEKNHNYTQYGFTEETNLSHTAII
jgi:hypothetical protein